jgi:replicative DNA helicase
MVGIINAADYGRTIYDAWVRRELIDIGEVVVNNAFGADAELNGTQQIEAAEQQLFDLATRGRSDDRMVTFEKALTGAINSAQLAFKQPGGISGLSTGLRDLDKKTGGLHKSDLLILAGRPGMGKTALATKIAFGAARALMANAAANPKQAKPGSVVIFSLEMSSEQLATRLLSEESRVSGERIRKGEIGEREFSRFVSAALHRRYAGDFAVRGAHALPAAGAHARAVAGGDRLSAIDAAIARDAGGKPGAGNQRHHDGAEGLGEGAGNSGNGAVAAFTLCGEPGR